MASPRRPAIVSGLRTPFARSGTVFKDVTAVQLARRVTQELLARTALDGALVDEVAFGQVVASVLAPNVAREVSLLPQLPRTVPAFSMNRACASAGQAITYAADQITLGHADVVLAGGVESLSDIPILHSKRMTQILLEASKAKTLGQRVGTFLKIRPRDLIPVSPAIAEPSTGESMGQSAEKMAKENGITREAQDRLALLSHQRAAVATQSGRLAQEIAPWFGGRGMDEVVTTDNLVRGDTSLEQLAKLKPVFDRRYGSVTAGNASALTDGAAVVLMMNEEKARALGYRPLAVVRSYAVAAVDPGWQLLMGPAYAVPKALDRAGITWKELGLVEIHEAFASQVLSNAQAWASPAWATKLGRSGPVGEVDWERTNVHGGSLAIGHPFGATGARIATTLANEMVHRDVQFGLISICAQGGMGFAMVLERV
ncbi:MAG: acetyl-CoA C-acyltransferase [Gemmatimonadetes bacterium]|nr:acetyl-CoA C-acyltransferase [Gemmatimonadota bacterium]MBK7784921.1 acetyl-CoA C-acyltransferase [Gemmatimonadota bacterium]MBK9066593.1 acetyl-CoA C-acyltransferase [Gemmatimonadota bacterium]